MCIRDRFSLSAASQSDDNTNDNSDNANHNGNDDNANDNGDDDNAKMCIRDRAIGEVGSGSNHLTRELLAANRMDEDSLTLLEISSSAAAAGLRDG